MGNLWLSDCLRIMSSKMHVSLNIHLLMVVVVVGNTLDYSYQNLSVFPEDVPTTTLKLFLVGNNISEIPSGALDTLHVLNDLQLPYNAFTAFPNLTAVADTLATLNLTGNSIVVVDGELLNMMENLKWFEMNQNLIENLPIFTSKLSGLLMFRCSDNLLNAMPVMEDPRKLEFLIIGQNRGITSIPDSYFNNFTSLHTLWIHSMNLHEFAKFPDKKEFPALERLYVPYNDIAEVPVPTMAALVNLRTLSLVNTLIVTLPPASSDYASLNLFLLNSAVDLCACDNLWIKQAAQKGASVQQPAATTCAGKLWAEMTLLELSDVCTSTHNARRLMNYRLHSSEFFCPGPLAGEVSVRSLVTCGILCTQTPGCLSLNYMYLPAGGRCVLVAPSHSNFTLTPQPHESWQFFVRDWKE